MNCYYCGTILTTKGERRRAKAITSLDHQDFKLKQNCRDFNGRIMAKKCQHGVRIGTCRDCKKLGVGGNELCDHNNVRYVCKICKSLGIGGKGICEHDNIRSRCKDCKSLGSGLCINCGMSWTRLAVVPTKRVTKKV
jgi:hypothetical protein